MQKLSKKEQQALADKVFKANPEYKKLCVCEDGNVFANEAAAKGHCKREKIEYNEFSTVKADVKSAKEAKEAEKEEKAEKPAAAKTDATEEMTEDEALAKLTAATEEDLEMKSVAELSQLITALKIEVKGKVKQNLFEALLVKKTELLNQTPSV